MYEPRICSITSLVPRDLEQIFSQALCVGVKGMGHTHTIKKNKKCSVWDSNLRAQRMVVKLGILTIEL